MPSLVQISNASGTRHKRRQVERGLVERRMARSLASEELKVCERKLGKVNKRLTTSGLTDAQIDILASTSSKEVREGLRPESIKAKKFDRLCSLLIAYRIERDLLTASIAATGREIEELKAMQETLSNR